MTETRPVVLAAGGTGGHIFPAQALAQALIARGRSVVLVTDRRGGDYLAGFEGIAVHGVRASGLGGRGVAGRLRMLADILIGTVQARQLLRRLRPAAVIGFGGYPSVPTMLAATMLAMAPGRCPTAIHEQNAVLGRANRLIAGRVARIATSFPTVAGLASASADHVVLTGNPVRAGVAALVGIPYPRPTTDGPLEVLVVGGSQGASVFGKIVPAALAVLPAALRRRLVLAQQCRPEDLDAVRAAYAEIGVEADLQSFFDDMPARLARAQLVIGRAGASTVAELAAAGRPAILVPYPHAIDDHQTANALAVEAAGAGWCMPQTAFCPDALAARLEALLALPETLSRAAQAARAFGHPMAAETLADMILALCDGNGAAQTVARRSRGEALA